MTDRYTKIVLTVIAFALSVIALRLGFTEPAKAMGDGCGGTRVEACYIQGYIGISGGVEVYGAGGNPVLVTSTN